MKYMNIVYAFIGKLPSYSIETVYQARLFFNGPIYFITNDYDSPLITVLESTYNVNVVRYDSVIHNEFNQVIQLTYSKFCIVNELKGREKLFIYAFERFFILQNLMIQQNLTDVFFMELDNLIYDDPYKWLNGFQKSEMAYMFDNYDRGASGICYIKSSHILIDFSYFCIEYILTHNGFLEEMGALYSFWINNKNRVKFLPVHWPDSSKPAEAHDNFEDYSSIFDAASIGIFLGGLDSYHTNGVLRLGLKGPCSLLDYTQYKYKWENDDMGRKIPYIFSGDIWYRINNLHVHSKVLVPCLSISLE
jgi:hypothetical protein